MSLQPLSRAIRGLTRVQKQKLGNIPRTATWTQSVDPDGFGDVSIYIHYTPPLTKAIRKVTRQSQKEIGSWLRF